MFNTYIYGTPLGFDFFEDVASLKEYFKGFYISSRKGRRLMVNRRDGGETFYNYLRYGLAEKGGRPNSFFGMSISMDNNEYAYDFKEIFDWFDYLFDKLVERGSLFLINAGNVIQYKITKFKDNMEEVQWLKNNIPNLFTKAQGVKLLEYDSTFSVSSSGQIRCFNDETSTTKILDAFKKCRWIALSPTFNPEEEPIEIDPSDIESQLNKYTQQLVPIAISPKKESLNVLHSIKSNCMDTIGLIQKYLSAEHDDSEQRNCALLIDKAKEIVINAKTIATKIQVSDPSLNSEELKTHLKRCKRCGRDLSLSKYVSLNAQFCKDCENQIDQSKTKKCSQCGKIKSQTEFREGSQICYDCKHRKSILDYIHPKRIAVVTVFVLIVGLSMCLILKEWKTDNPYDRGEENIGYGQLHTSTENENMVNASRFDTCLIKYDFLGAYGELDGKDNSTDYLPRLKSSVESYLWDLIDNPDNKSATEEIQSFFIFNQRIIEKIGVYDNTWLQYARAYDKLMTLIQQKSLNKKQKSEAYKLIDALPDYPVTIKETLRTRIDNMRSNADDTTTASKVATEPSETGSDYIELIDSNGSKKITKCSGFDYPDGARITIKSDKKLTISNLNKLKKEDTDNISQEEDKKTMTIVVKANMQVIVSISDKIQLTINGKQGKQNQFTKVR